MGWDMRGTLGHRRFVARRLMTCWSCVTESGPSLTFLATVDKILKEILQSEPGMVFAKDTRDLLIECCVEFLTLVSSESNEIAEKDAKKTIGYDHVKQALEDLGFGDMVPHIAQVASEFKDTQAVCLAMRVLLGHADLYAEARTEADQDRTERNDRGRVGPPTAGALPVCDGKVPLWPSGIHSRVVVREWTLRRGATLRFSMISCDRRLAGGFAVCRLQRCSRWPLLRCRAEARKSLSLYYAITIQVYGGEA